jgi:hypothetical protein
MWGTFVIYKKTAQSEHPHYGQKFAKSVHSALDTKNGFEKFSCCTP